MKTNRTWPIWAALLCLVTGCATASPPSRLPLYVALNPPSGGAVVPLPTERPLRAVLVVVDDQSAPDATPTLPDGAQSRLVERLRDRINQGYPLIVERAVSLGAWPPGTPPPNWAAMAEQLQADHLLVVVLSSVEQEYPTSLFLGWTVHRQPGVRRDNWSLAEAALIEGAGGRTLLTAEGRAMATLDSPTAPGINQWYPVIYLRPQDPERRIWPPSYDAAPVTLRVVAMDSAFMRLAGNLQRAWVEQRDRESSSAPLPAGPGTRFSSLNVSE